MNRHQVAQKMKNLIFQKKRKTEENDKDEETWGTESTNRSGELS